MTLTVKLTVHPKELIGFQAENSRQRRVRHPVIAWRQFAQQFKNSFAAAIGVLSRATISSVALIVRCNDRRNTSPEDQAVC